MALAFLDEVPCPVDDEGMPLFLEEWELSGDLSQHPDTCPHEGVREEGQGMASGRFSNGDEYVIEKCFDCGTVTGGYWTGGVM